MALPVLQILELVLKPFVMVGFTSVFVGDDGACGTTDCTADTHEIGDSLEASCGAFESLEAFCSRCSTA